MAASRDSWLDDAPAFAQARVALYLATLAGFFAAFYLIDAVSFALDGELARMRRPAALVHLAVVAALVFGWQLARRGARPPALTVAVEVIATLLVGGLASLAVASSSRGDIHAGPAFGTALVHVVRAAIVPSSMRRTLAVGLPSAVSLPAAYELAGDPHDLDAGFVAVWMTFFVAAAAVVSRVIYGLAARLRRARKLGQYVLEEKIGEGGMGVVHRARHGMLRRPTAIKLLRPGAKEDHALVRFEREVQMTARLSHPNTVTIYDYGRTDDGLFYYAMELLDGADLEEVVAVDGPQPAERVAHVLRAVAGALAEAHEIGLIHRDIKPSNIMLCRQGGVPDTPKVLDFGLVHEIGVASSVSHSGTVVGTPLYMSPEAISDPRAVDERSDLYALGAVGYYLLTGQHVFTGRNAFEVCHQHLEAAPIPPSQRLGQPVPPAVEEVVLACLAKDKGARPAGAADLQQRLRDLPPWDAGRARAWWERFEPALRGRRAESRAAGTGASLEIHPVRS